MPMPAQAALLRVLEEREVVPVGDSVPVPVDPRVVAATHRDLGAMVAAGKFREDLYARIRGLAITLPPLRDRRVDLGLLIPALLRRQPRAEKVRFTPQAASLLFEHAWPRNIRELARALEVATAMADGQPIAIEHLPEELRGPRAAGPEAGAMGAAAPPPRAGRGLAGRRAGRGRRWSRAGRRRRAGARRRRGRRARGGAARGADADRPRAEGIDRGAAPRAPGQRDRGGAAAGQGSNSRSIAGSAGTGSA